MHVNFIWDKLGWMGGSAWTGDFFHSPVGFASLVVILICSAHNIFSAAIDDGLFDRIYYWSCVFATGAGIWCVLSDKPPYNIIKIIVVGLAIRLVISLIQRRLRFHQTGEIQKTFGR